MPNKAQPQLLAVAAVGRELLVKAKRVLSSEKNDNNRE